jgi:phage shock protein A
MKASDALHEIAQLETAIRDAEQYLKECDTIVKTARERVKEAVMDLRTYIHKVRTGQLPLILEMPIRQTEAQRQTEDDQSDRRIEYDGGV